MNHSMSGCIPTIGGSGLFTQNPVRTAQQQSGVLGTWSGHLTWDMPRGSAAIGNHYPVDYGPATSAYYIPKDITVNFTSTGNAQPVNQAGWNISPFPGVPGTDHMYNACWDMRDPQSKFDIYRLHITSMTATVTSNLIATIVGYQYYEEPTYHYAAGAFIKISDWSNEVWAQGLTNSCRYTGYPAFKWASADKSGSVSTKTFSDSGGLNARLTWGASAAFTYPAGSMNWSGTAYPVLDPHYHYVQPELESSYTWLDLNAAGYIERIPMPSAYK